MCGGGYEQTASLLLVRSKEFPMGLGLGVVLVVVGAVLMWALQVNLSWVDDNTLGLILFIVGIVTIVLSLIMNVQRRRTTHIEQRRYDG